MVRGSHMHARRALVLFRFFHLVTEDELKVSQLVLEALLLREHPAVFIGQPLGSLKVANNVERVVQN